VLGGVLNIMGVRCMAVWHAFLLCGMLFGCLVVLSRKGYQDCMYACVGVCMYVCVLYVCMYVCMYVCIYIPTKTHMHTYLCVTQFFLGDYVHMYVCMYKMHHGSLIVHTS
jgi:hypothetical protein